MSNQEFAYVATDLLDIAQDFEERARGCRGRSQTAIKKRDKFREFTEADVWNQAAAILRRTTIKAVAS